MDSPRLLVLKAGIFYRHSPSLKETVSPKTGEYWPSLHPGSCFTIPTYRIR